MYRDIFRITTLYINIGKLKAAVRIKDLRNAIYIKCFGMIDLNKFIYIT